MAWAFGSHTALADGRGGGASDAGCCNCVAGGSGGGEHWEVPPPSHSRSMQFCWRSTERSSYMRSRRACSVASTWVVVVVVVVVVRVVVSGEW